MKGKKEYFLLILVIAALSAYLFVQKRDKIHYTLPEPAAVKEEAVSRLTISKADTNIVLQRENDQWLIIPERFPADPTLVGDMINGAGKLTLTALASESRNYSLYELDDGHKISIELNGGNEVLRKVDVGKAAPSGRHTFLRLNDNHSVFHAQGNLVNLFDKTVSDLRDKEVMKIDEEITGISLSSGEDNMVLVKSMKPETDEEESKENAAAPEASWQTEAGQPVKEADIEEIINTLRQLRCDDFVDGKTKADYENPVYSVSLKGTRTYTLSIFEKTDNKYEATSSESDYPFLLPEWKATRIMKEITALPN
jgi:hypothetical protein